MPGGGPAALLQRAKPHALVDAYQALLEWARETGIPVVRYEDLRNRARSAASASAGDRQTDTNL